MTITVPSPRNFEIFHAVQTLQMSRRGAAEVFGISPTRVQQIVTEVKRFVIRHGSVEIVGDAEEDLEKAALRLCYERLNYMFYSAMHVWRGSQGELTVVRRCGAKETSTTAPSFGAVRVFHAAMKAAIEQTKVAKVLANLLREERNGQPQTEREPIEYVLADEEEDDGATEPAQPAARMPTAATAAATPLASPPVSGCTVATPPVTSSVFADALAQGSTLDDQLTCDGLMNALMHRRLALRQGKAPAHSAKKRRRAR
jgi:hypothetical protein